MASTSDPEWKSAAPFLGEHLGLLRGHYSFSGYERDLVCLNRRDGTFLDVSGVSGVDSVSDGRAAVFLDYNDDGAMDIFLRAMHGPARFLFRNEATPPRSSVRVALVGTRSGRDAFGAVVRVETSAGTLTKIKSGGAGFLAQHDPRLVFGLGDDKLARRVEVTWPSGARSTSRNLRPGGTLVLTEPTD